MTKSRGLVPSSDMENNSIERRIERIALEEPNKNLIPEVNNEGEVIAMDPEVLKEFTLSSKIMSSVHARASQAGF